MARFALQLLCCLTLVVGACRFSHDKQRELARQDSLAHDSTRKVVNPYKVGQGTQIYDQQRESLGNLDTLVTPKDPGIPGQ